MPENKSENYIRRSASRLLTYRDFVEKFQDPFDGSTDSAPGPKNIAKIFGDMNDLLTKPRFPSDAIDTFDGLKKLLANSSYEWSKEVEAYVKSIFPSIPRSCPTDIGQDRLAGVKIDAWRTFGCAKQMLRLSYMFTLPPKKWREWKLLEPTPYNASATDDAVRSLRENHRAYLLPFCDEYGYLKAPSYNELLSYMEFELSDGSPEEVGLRKEALLDAVSVFQEYGLYRIKFGKKMSWERDFFRFERPDIIEGRLISGGTGTIRVVMPSGYADVGLKNHFPLRLPPILNHGSVNLRWNLRFPVPCSGGQRAALP